MASAQRAEEEALRFHHRLEQHCINIWGYVRMNKDSLNSEIAMKKIRAAFETAIAEVEENVAAVERENSRLRKRVSELRRQVNIARKATADAMAGTVK